jgi:hypothetical protein
VTHEFCLSKTSRLGSLEGTEADMLTAFPRALYSTDSGALHWLMPAFSAGASCF